MASWGKEEVMTRNAVTIGVLGYGYWGPNLARNFVELEDAYVKYICDADPDKLALAGETHPGVGLVSDTAVVLNDPEVDAVVISTPAVTHYSLSRKALLAGKHVLVEKPLSLQVAEGEDLVKLVEDTGLTLMVGHILVYHPAIQYIKKYMAAGELGDIHYAYSQRLNLGRIRQDENCLWSLAPHDIASMIYLIDSKPVSVVARGASYITGRLEDVVFFTIDFEGGQKGNAHVSWLDPRKVRMLTVVGSRKMAVFDDMASDGKLRIFDKRVYPEVSEDAVGYEEVLRLHFGEDIVPPIEALEPLKLECRHFLDATRSGATPLTGARHGLAVLRVLDAASRSMESGGHPAAIETGA